MLATLETLAKGRQVPAVLGKAEGVPKAVPGNGTAAGVGVRGVHFRWLGPGGLRGRPGY